MSSNQETTIRLIGTEMTIFGSTLIPFVSSSKNLKRPALDAGNAALVFLSAMTQTQKFRIKSFGYDFNLEMVSMSKLIDFNISCCFLRSFSFANSFVRFCNFSSN